MMEVGLVQGFYSFFFFMWGLFTDRRIRFKEGWLESWSREEARKAGVYSLSRGRNTSLDENSAARTSRKKLVLRRTER